MSSFAFPTVRIVLIPLILGALSQVACSEDAIVGTELDPIACTEVDGEISGSSRLENPQTGEIETYSFDDVQAISFNDSVMPQILSLYDVSQQLLEFHFLCGQYDIGHYDVTDSTEVHPDACPYWVSAATATGGLRENSISGVLLIDDASTCLAGRFDLDMSAGGFSGWFQVPLAE